MSNLSTDVVDVKKPAMSIFNDMESFANGQRMAQVLTQSNIVPQGYQNNLPNVMVALELANRVGVSPIMVMQNLDIIKGKPSWSSTFIIAVLNSCGRFSQLRFKFEGTKGTPEYGCIAWATDLKTGETLESPIVDWKMVHAEGWVNKTGSKWKTMPDLMFHYRAASFFGRIYASDILKGMQSADEVLDVANTAIEVEVTDEELERIKTFIAKAETVKKLDQIKSQIGNAKYEELLDYFEEREKEIIFDAEVNEPIIVEGQSETIQFPKNN